MNNKAFTLVELLGVLIILAIISLLVFPAVSSIIDKSTDTVYKNQINTILKATYDFSLKNTTYLPARGQKSYVTLGELKYLGLVDVNIEDPTTNSKFPDNLVISIDNVGAGYKYSNANAKLEGDYLYAVEVERLKNTDMLPIITLSDLTKNTNGSYIITLNLNDELPNISYSAISQNSIDLTNKVKSYITKNEIAVDTIDSSHPDIYKINYVVVDDDGYASQTVLNIIIADTEKPIINLPTSTTIDTSVSSFNFLNGVSCTDNSGFCDITYTQNVIFGVKDKYIVEYTAKDPSGNTSTARRVITIE